MSGDWPAEWEDAEDVSPWADDQVDTEAEARLSEVAAYLAAAPAPTLPDAFAARISAAIAAEAADRATSPAEAPVPVAAPEPAAGHAPTGRRRGRGRTRGPVRSRPLLAVGSALACLVLLGFGFLVSHGASSSSSSAPSAGAPAEPSSVSASSSGGAFGADEAGPADSASSTAGGSFSVTESGTAYQKSTLATQVRDNLTGNKSGASAVPGAASTSSAAASGSRAVTSGTPTTQLRGCVLQVTGGTTPQLVDRATYQGEAVYIIATSSRVWVVGLGCTATMPEVIVTTSLAS